MNIAYAEHFADADALYLTLNTRKNTPPHRVHTHKHRGARAHIMTQHTHGGNNY